MRQCTAWIIIIDAGDGLSSCRFQAIIWINADIVIMIL